MTYDKDSFLAGLSVGMSLRYSKRIPAPLSCLTFSSPSAFTLSVANATKNWDGTLESSTDAQNWSAWDGTAALSAIMFGGNYKLYLRGTNNTRMTSNYSSSRWVLSGNNISCNGDIRNLLNYTDKENTTMQNGCFRRLFSNCTSLITPPELPAMDLSIMCYASMFYGCTGLLYAPELPAIDLRRDNEYGSETIYQTYQGMFTGCTSLTSPPELPAIAVGSSCYASMFQNCTSLTYAPELKAERVNPSAYASMFRGCTSLVSVQSVLRHTTGDGCCSGMFSGCTSLVTPPELPAASDGIVFPNAYNSMFFGCTSLKTAPSLPSTDLAQSAYAYMFKGCTALESIPDIHAARTGSYSCEEMFSGCTKIKISQTQTGDYQSAYKIPSSGLNTFRNMFSGTGGTFTGTPSANTTYYTSNTVIS